MEIQAARVPDTRLLCSIELITNHGHNESDCTVGERKMDCKFFSRLIKDHLSLEPQGIHSIIPLRRSLRCPATNIVLQGLPKDIYKLINHNIEAKAIWDNVKMLLTGYELTKEDRESQLYNEFERQWGAQNRAGNANAGQGKPVKCYNYNGVGHIARNCTQPKHPQNSDYFKDKMLLMQAQENGAVLDEEELLFLAGEQGNTFDADVDNQPVQRTWL
ncbi:retrovirus-related pol polyprotein from transposon TNT 1-94 [Tanacetum coccineum]|uniref:Retrovirus-related pol polyprotein from transposon TNT 1-94 n=1 Tax=Tanacetum coccineum TaxID=301880 RepID=A0ABQ5A1V3_9ASTR